MVKLLRNNPVKFILLASIVIFVSHLGILYVNIMEARNFITAREMVNDGNWLLTTMNGLPRYEKPPLPTWLTAFSSMLFGQSNVFGLRLPAALAAIFMIVVFYKNTLKIYNDKRFGLIAGLILATSFYVIFSGRNGQWDIFTHSFMVASIYFLFQFLNDDENVWKNALLASLFFGFSFLSKGPVSLYALWLPFLTAYGLTYKFKSLKSKLFPFITFLVLGLGIGISWFIYVRVTDPASFLEITKEEAANWGSYNIRPFYYYWSFFTQSGIWTIPAFISLLYPYLKNKVSNKKAYRFSFAWTMASVIFLSLVPEKKARYLLPVLIPLALNTAFYIEYLINNFKSIKNKKETLPVYFNFGLIAIIGIVFPIAGYIFFKGKLSGLWLYFILASVSLLAIGILILLQLKKKNIEHVFYLTIAFIMSIMLFGFPLSKAFNTNTAFKSTRDLNRETLKIYSFGENAPEIIWEFGKKAPRIDVHDKITFPDEKVFGLLVPTSNNENFRRIFDKNFLVIKEEAIDLNYTVSPGKKNHKNRLTSSYYIIKKQ
ncbi:ArnT family glycosyltransferase [Abyssalbus ytuae]|uniref:Glycosyltransferase family 39 protein n=1 Tax=Abyssalbus ytuae TaxID=2926907 RepID=A0A9E7A1I7_9FLAO|nr:glycosyltransferase family 39 protein [Abyssalbus ytuae]UOB18021.1 glycosyltransferase family 39 protein [Abyssalbus ytuae]